jgi:hypothetical protein
MIERIRTGVMFLENGTHMPESITLNTGQFAGGWSDILGSTSAQLSKQIEKAGWTFLFLAGEIQVNGFGMNDQSRSDHAMAHLIDAVKLRKCNCLEITRMRRRSFLGFPYTSVSAHARNIQKNRSFHELSGSSLPEAAVTHA